MSSAFDPDPTRRRAASAKGLFVAVFAVFWLCFAGARSAGAESEPVHLDYEAYESCPDAARFFFLVLDRTPRVRQASRGESARTFLVRIHPSAAGARGRLLVREGTQLMLSREISGKRCADVASALALAAALAIDPDASDTAPLPNGAAEGDQNQPVANSALEADRPVAPHANTDAPSPVWRAGALGALALGVAPTFSYGAALLVERGERAVISAIGAELVFLQAPASTLRTAHTDFHFFFARPRLCAFEPRPFSALAIGPCAAAELGVVGGAGSNIAQPASENRFWAALDLELRLRLSLGGDWFAQAGAAAIFPLTRYRFVFRDPETAIHSIPVVAAAASAGLGHEF